jgi:hypothetical protein
MGKCRLARGHQFDGLGGNGVGGKIEHCESERPANAKVASGEV